MKTDAQIEVLLRRAEIYTARARTRIRNGEKTEARRYLSRAFLTLEVLKHARLVRAVTALQPT